jgi:hypothetical protein
VQKAGNSAFGGCEPGAEGDRDVAITAGMNC